MNNFKGGGRLEVLYICLLFLIFFFRLTTREGHQKLKNNHPQYKLWNRQNQKKEILSTGVDMLFLGIQKEMVA